MNASDAAETMGYGRSEGKAIRRMLRESAESTGAATPGKGGSWEITSADIPALKARFDAWRNGEGRRRGGTVKVSALLAESPAESAPESTPKGKPSSK